MTSAVLPASRSKTIALWILRVLMVDEFNTIGLGQWFRYFTGALELAGGIAILVPSVSVFAAIVLLAVDVGAFVTQIAVLHGDWIHTVVIGAILGAVIYLQRDRFGSWG
jgi:putative oxidoreductase